MYAFKNSGLTKEQLTNMGVTGKDALQGTVQTQLFPPLNCRPIEIKNYPSMDYKIVWKDDFRSHLFDTHSNSELNLTDESYSSKMANALEKEHKKKLQFKFAFPLMPQELRPIAKRKAVGKPNKVKRIKVITPEVMKEKLEILEKKELENPEVPETTSVKGDNESDDEFENEDEERMEDQEMDEGDYENNYFDNGEGYNDEDDNLDDGDGPVY